MNFAAANLPDDFDEFVEDLLAKIDSVEGYLAPNEIRFLALLGAVKTAPGEILEIGSFKGKSTIILAKAAALQGNATVHAVDPMIAPSETDPDLGDDQSSFPDFERNITEHGVSERIRLHQKFSHELAENWELPIRLLWIDGDHTYEGTKRDFEGFADHLSDGAIVAIHDVLHEFEGGVRVFIENILLSPNFGACGFVGSIAWAQFHKDPGVGKRFRDQKLMLYKRLSRLIPFLVFHEPLTGMAKKRYKLYRSRIPRAAVKPAEWIGCVEKK